MKKLRKIIDSKNLQNFQENIFDGIYFSKVASLQCKDGISTIFIFEFHSLLPMAMPLLLPRYWFPAFQMVFAIWANKQLKLTSNCLRYRNYLSILLHILYVNIILL